MRAVMSGESKFLSSLRAIPRFRLLRRLLGTSRWCPGDVDDVAAVAAIGLGVVCGGNMRSKSVAAVGLVARQCPPSPA
jgi:hypothetical protein